MLKIHLKGCHHLAITLYRWRYDDDDGAIHRGIFFSRITNIAHFIYPMSMKH